MNPRNLAEHHTSLGVRPRSPDAATRKPMLLQMAEKKFYSGIYSSWFKHEITAPKVNSDMRLNRMMRIANAFTFVNPSTENMVQLKHDDDTKKYCGLEMIAFIAPLNIGQRRGCRLLSGYTPLYKGRSDSRVWGYMGEYARVKVKWPLFRKTTEILGHQFDEVWILSDCGRIAYMLQHPDPHYQAIYKRTIREWERITPEGVERLCEFESVDLTMPCQSWMIRWVYQLLRLEHKIILRARDSAVEGGVEGHEGLDNVSDAGSLSDEQAGDVPHSTKWEWERAQRQGEQEQEQGEFTEAPQVPTSNSPPIGRSSPLFPPSEPSPPPSESPAKETHNELDASSPIPDFLIHEQW